MSNFALQGVDVAKTFGELRMDCCDEIPHGVVEKVFIDRWVSAFELGRGISPAGDANGVRRPSSE